MKMRSV